MGDVHDPSMERARAISPFPAKPPLEVGKRYNFPEAIGTGSTFEVLMVGATHYFIRSSGGTESTMIVGGNVARDCTPVLPPVERWVFAVYSPGHSYMVERSSETSAIRHRANYARVAGQAVSEIVYVRLEPKAVR